MSRRGENIFKRKDGRWEGRYSIGRNEQGRLIYHSVYGRSYRDVKDRINCRKNEVVVCSPGLRNGHSHFDEDVQRWFGKLAVTRKHSTVIKYQNIYDKYIYPILGEKETNKIICEDLKTTLNNAGIKVNRKEISISTFNSIRGVLKQIISFLLPEYQFDTIARDICFCKCRTVTPVVLSLAEQYQLERYLLNDIDRYKLGILICLYTGLRVGEICALTTDAINIEKRSISVTQTVQRIKVSGQVHKTELRVTEPKTFSSQREIPICDYLAAILKVYMPDSKYLLGNNPYEPRTYQYKLKKYFKCLSIEKKHFHTLRHTFATNCIACGMDSKCLSEILGHADVKTTLNRYVHPSFDNKIQQINSVADNCQINGHFTI